MEFCRVEPGFREALGGPDNWTRTSQKPASLNTEQFREQQQQQQPESKLHAPRQCKQLHLHLISQ